MPGAAAVVEAVDRVTMTPEELDQLGDFLQRDVPEVLQLDLTFELENAAAPSITIRFSIPLLWGVFQAMHRGGIHETSLLAIFGHLIFQHLEHAGVDDELIAFQSIWVDMGHMFRLDVNRWDNDEDLAISFSYCLLSERLISRRNAAAIAPFLVTEEEPPEGWDSLADTISADAWRLKVDRWAARHKLDPVGIRQRRPK